MSDDRRDLVHQINNLLAVIYSQVGAARAARTEAAALTALELIQQAAERTAERVHQLRDRSAGG